MPSQTRKTKTRKPQQSMRFHPYSLQGIKKKTIESAMKRLENKQKNNYLKYLQRSRFPKSTNGTGLRVAQYGRIISTLGETIPVLIDVIDHLNGLKSEVTMTNARTGELRYMRGATKAKVNKNVRRAVSRNGLQMR